MRRIPLVLIALVLGFGMTPAVAQARYEGPWCAVYSLGFAANVRDCSFRDFESCRMEVIGGNRGFCDRNLDWRSTAKPARKTYRKRAR